MASSPFGRATSRSLSEFNAHVQRLLIDRPDPRKAESRNRIRTARPAHITKPTG